MATQTRPMWGSRLGFILAAAGSAIGLGNVWKFPYTAGMNGGGAFVLVYLGAVLLIGLPIMLAELLIGRSAQRNVVGAFKALSPKPLWQGAGWLGLATGFVILSFYSVVAGWVIAYFFKSLAGFPLSGAANNAAYEALSGNPFISMGWHTFFMVLCVGVVIGGIKGGIERWSSILMSVLFALLVALTGYSMIAQAGGQALRFLFVPRWAEFSTTGILEALGQAFFSLSLGMGAMITYGSYLNRETRLVRSALWILGLDTLLAIMAGLMIFPIVFAAGIPADSGPGLIFKTLPALFAHIPGGRLVGPAFFLLLIFAAVTSGISLLEVVVSFLVDERKWSRPKATVVVGLAAWLLGLPSAVSSLAMTVNGKAHSFFDIMDFLASNIMLPVGGLLVSLFVGWVLSRELVARELGLPGPVLMVLRVILRFVAPLAVAVVFMYASGILAPSPPSTPQVHQSCPDSSSHDTK